MKALSFRQPWAELILGGRKTMDLRTYGTAYRGPLAIHASKIVEQDACRLHDLDSNTLPTGGVVGVVQLVDILPLSEMEYEGRKDEHLAGRRYRRGMHGWVLARPNRLPQVIPFRGRQGIFTVDEHLLEPSSQTTASARDLEPPTARVPRRSRPTYRTAHDSGDPSRPFTLLVVPTANANTSYNLALLQRLLDKDSSEEAASRAEMVNIVTLGGDNLRAIADHVIEALRQGGYKATDLSPECRTPFFLPEAVGVRLGLTLLTVKPLSKMKRIENISEGIRAMPLEETYYWYSKCTAENSAERAQKALRVLLAAE